jgi:hypothetical protein
VKLNIYLIVTLLSYFGASNSGWLCCFRSASRVTTDFEKPFLGDDSTGGASNESNQVVVERAGQQNSEAEVVETDSGNLNRPKEGDSVAILKLPQEQVSPTLEVNNKAVTDQSGWESGSQQDLEAEVVLSYSCNFDKPKESNSVEILELPQEQQVPPILAALHHSNRRKAGSDVGQRIWLSDL